MREFWKAIYRWKRLERQIPYSKTAIREAITHVLAIFESLYKGNSGFGEYLNLIETASRILDERFRTPTELWSYHSDGDKELYFRRVGRFVETTNAGGDSMTRWIVLPRPFEGLKNFIINHFPIRQINSPYDCTGEWFSWKPTVHRTPTGITIHQHWGQDI